MKLYDYFRSSAAYRVRIALNLKGLEVEHIPVNLLKSEQLKKEYTKVNPAGRVPALDLGGGKLLTQSLAIIEFLDETYTRPPLLPKTPEDRAYVRALSMAIACDIHPVNNLRVMNYLKGPLKHSQEEADAWYHHWIVQGLTTVEAMLGDSGRSKKYCFDETPTMADCCLVPQVFNAERYKVPLDPFPLIRNIALNCNEHPAFQAAHPSKQVDAVA